MTLQLGNYSGADNECLSLPKELERVDRFLDDPVFIEPFRAHLDPAIGRPSIPMETYLRLMFRRRPPRGSSPCSRAPPWRQVWR
jgi:hypothetical protein